MSWMKFDISVERKRRYHELGIFWDAFLDERECSVVLRYRGGPRPCLNEHGEDIGCAGVIGDERLDDGLIGSLTTSDPSTDQMSSIT